MMWVDDTIPVLTCSEDRPIRGVLVDQRTYFSGGCCESRCRTSHSRTVPHGDPRSLRSPAPAAVEVKGMSGLQVRAGGVNRAPKVWGGQFR